MRRNHVLTVAVIPSSHSFIHSYIYISVNISHEGVLLGLRSACLLLCKCTLMYFFFSLDITTLLRFSSDKFYSFYFLDWSKERMVGFVLRSRPGPSNSALSFLLIIQAKGDEMMLMHGTARYDIVLWGDWFIPHPPPGPSFFFHHQNVHRLVLMEHCTQRHLSGP